MTAARCAALERALAGDGFHVRVADEGGIALIVPCAPTVADAALRARAWPLARAAGFTHAAIELLDDADGAPLPRG